MDGGQNGVVHPLRMTVAGELVPVEVGNDEVGGVEPPEGEPGIPFVALQKEHVPPHFAAQRTAAENQRSDALDLVGPLRVVDNLLSAPAENGRDHLHSGGLAVAAGDGDDTGRQGDAAQNVRTDFQRELSGQGAALAHPLPDEAQQLTDNNG